MTVTLQRFAADLHIHTALSPCGSDYMTPETIVLAARRAGLRMIAICDHNSASNVGALRDAALTSGITVIAGAEISTAEGFHVTCLFATRESAESFTAEIMNTLPMVDADYTRHYGTQLVFAADGTTLRYEDRQLARRCAMGLPTIGRMVSAHGGLLIGAHVDRLKHSILGDLEVLPSDVRIDALEVSPVNSRAIGIKEKFARHRLPLIASSDAHFPEEIGRARTYVTALAPTFEEFRAAIGRQEGREVSFA